MWAGTAGQHQGGTQQGGKDMGGLFGVFFAVLWSRHFWDACAFVFCRKLHPLSTRVPRVKLASMLSWTVVCWIGLRASRNVFEICRSLVPVVSCVCAVGVGVVFFCPGPVALWTMLYVIKSPFAALPPRRVSFFVGRQAPSQQLQPTTFYLYLRTLVREDNLPRASP